MSVEIRPVETRRERATFVKMPWQIYHDDPHWVPPLIGDQKKMLSPDKGLFYRYGDAKLFMAYRDGKPVGRISAHLSKRHDELYHDGKGFFGFFECEENPETAHALFEAAEAHLKDNDRRTVEGPLSFSIYDEIAILVDGFDTDPYVLNVHNPPYYRSLLEQSGYEKSVDWYAFRAKRGGIDVDLPKKYKKLGDRLLKRGGVTLRNMDNGKNFDRDAEIVRQIFMSAWDQNWGHVPMTDEEWKRVSDLVKLIMIPELSVIAEVEGRPVGFALSVYDANITAKKLNGRLFPIGFIRLLTEVKKANRFRLILMGMLEEYRGKGYEAAFYLHIAEKGGAMGFDEAELSLVVETNEPMLRSLDHLPGLERYKTYRIFRKDL